MTIPPISSPISSLVPSLPSLPDIPGIGGAGQAATTPGAGSDFTQILTQSVGKLEQSQQAADQGQTALATGQTQDVSSVVLATEKASLNLNLAANVRTQMVNAYLEVMRMQV
jgi:flagellar hook-basal body complex protein FliE